MPKVSFWSPFHSKYGPLLVPFLKNLGSLSRWEQCPPPKYSPYCLFLRLGTNISALLFLWHIPFPIYPSLAYISVYKLIHCLYIVHKSVSQVLVTSMLQKFGIYRVYCSLKIVDISVPQTNILPIYRLNIISDTLVPRAFRKYSTCL